MSTEGLPGRLTALVNTLVEAQADDEVAQLMTNHIEQWADGMYSGEKELFLEAIARRSSFTITMIQWIAHVTKLLLAVSNAAACNDDTRDKLRRSAVWLISVFSWVPDEKEPIDFVERLNMTEKLFDVAVEANRRGLDEFVDEVRDLIMTWAFKAGKFDTKSEILERAFCGLATLDIARGLDGSQLITALTERLAQNNSIVQANLDRAADEILERAETFDRGESTSSIIDRAMERTDPSKLRPLLQEIANLLSSRPV